MLSKYFGVADPAPDDLTGVDVAVAADPDEWDETTSGIAPLLSETGYDDLMPENAVARICLEPVADRLPQWAAVSNGKVTLGRTRRRRTPTPRRATACHLFTINWGDSGPGFSWPETYHVATLGGYDLSVVTASDDSPDAHGYSDFAIGWFRPSGSTNDQIRDCVTAW